MTYPDHNAHPLAPAILIAFVLAVQQDGVFETIANRVAELRSAAVIHPFPETDLWM